MTDRLDQAIRAAEEAVRQLAVDYDGGPYEELMRQYARALIADLLKDTPPEYRVFFNADYMSALDDLCDRVGLPYVHRGDEQAEGREDA